MIFVQFSNVFTTLRSCGSRLPPIDCTRAGECCH